MRALHQTSDVSRRGFPSCKQRHDGRDAYDRQTLPLAARIAATKPADVYSVATAVAG
jgi:hypothetical protein